MLAEEEETVGLEGEEGVAGAGGGALKMFALAIERRERMRSSGYVVPTSKPSMTWLQRNEKGRSAQTDVIPAKAPLTNLVGVSSCFVPFAVNHWRHRRGMAVH